MLEKKVNLFDVPLDLLFTEVKKHFPNHHYNFKKHVAVIEDEEYNTLGYIRLPLHLSLDQNVTVTDDEALVLYLSIESGNAAICVMEGKHNVYHTTFSSQVKYLNKKGKSRAGSRVRLASTIDFFENINTTLEELFEEYEVERIGLHCSTSLIPYLHQSKVTCPFDKKDERLYKIPVHLPQSNFTNLNGAIKKLMAPTLFYDEKHEILVNALIADIQ